MGTVSRSFLPSATLCLALLLSCADATTSRSASGGADRSPSTGDWLVWADVAEPTTLNCVKATERAAAQICRLVADSLIDFDSRLELVPRLASDFSISPDGLTIEMSLRSGVRWHDGIPFTAEDVLYTVELVRRLDPGGERFDALFGPLKEVTAPDATTIRAVYEEPFIGALVGWRELLIMPAHLAFDPTGPSDLDRAPVGTGPFRFVRWDPQERIVLDANVDYFGGRPYVDRYVHRILPNAEAMRAAAEAGTVDVSFMTTEWLRRNQDSTPGFPYRVLTYPTRTMQMIYWNLHEPKELFGDARVRRAMTMLLDRTSYVEKVHHDVYRTATTLIDPVLWGGDPRLAAWPYDPAGAALLLDEAGLVDRDGDGTRDGPGGPMSFTLVYTPITPGNREIAAMLERSAAQVGVRVRLLELEWTALRSRFYEHRFEAVLFSWALEPFPDPFAYFHSSQIEAGFNVGAYRSEAFDELAEAARRTTDPRRADELLRRMQRLLHEDQPCTFVAIAGAVAVVHDRFRTPEVTAAGLWNWYPSVQRWWVPPGRRKYR